jgi:putative ABC transport system permease protein
MLKTYFKIAFRNIRNNKIFSFINIFGLAVGLTCCMLISLYIYNELRYDTYHKDADRVFQVNSSSMDGETEKKGATVSAPIGRVMQQDYPGIELSTRMLRLFRDDKTLFQVKDASGVRSFYETKGYLADSNFFQVVTYDLKEGNPKTALLDPLSVVLSEELADKFFGKQPAIDKVVHISSSTNGDHDFKVSGVYKAPPAPSHIDAQFFISFGGGNWNELANQSQNMVNNNMFYTYVKLNDKTDAGQLSAKFPAFVEKHMGEELRKAGRKRNYFLTNITKLHLVPDMENVTPPGNRTSLFILASIAVLTLLIACINFMNLSTSGSAKRAAEVGVRKVLGAQKNALLKQFLGESLLMTAIALIFAIALVILLLPVFESISGKNLRLPGRDYALMFAGFLTLAIITGLLAGSYPAFYLSSFKPIKVLKGKFSNSLAAVSLRKGMVVFQFVISIVLIVASVVIANQMKYLRSKDLGFTRDQQIIVPLRTQPAKATIPAFKAVMASNTAVSSIGGSMSYPGIFHPQDWLLYKQGESPDQTKKVYINLVDDNLLQTLGIRPVAGRLFSRDFPADTLTRFVINEEAVKQFGFKSPEDAIGKWLGAQWGDEQAQFTIVGVVKDFHFKDLHEAVEPFAFRLYNDADFNYLVFHSNTGKLNEALASLETTWKKLNPNEPFEYSFLDLDFQKNYESETQQASLINYFTIVAIIISCLGLFGLVTFSAEQRTKEIGIRKVLGASVAGIVGLISKDFLKLVAIAVVIASPLAWYVMNQWLENFAYRTNITWDVFVLTTLLAMFIAFTTISIQAIKAALANPVKNLRTE